MKHTLFAAHRAFLRATIDRLAQFSTGIRFLPCILSLLMAGTILAADPGEEQQLIQILQSNASLKEKDAACARLKRIGTAQSVPALGALLVNQNLSHSARYALEAMSAPEAGRALTAGLAQSASMTRVGIINSLGARREAEAISHLEKLLGDSNASVAAAAATALGQIGGSRAAEVLMAAHWPAIGAVHDAVADATLRCANDLRTTGQNKEALALFRRVFAEPKTHFRIASYRGMVLSSGRGGVKLMTDAIAGEPGPAHVASLQLVRDIEPRSATGAFVKLLPKVPADVQVALIEGLAQRGDPAAAAGISKLAKSGVPEVRQATLNALGTLGDQQFIPLLTEAAATAAPAEQTAARKSLVVIYRGKITQTILAQLASAAPAIQTELARALGERGDSAAVPKLLDLAKHGSDSARKAALAALALLAGQADIHALVELVATAASETTRAQAIETLTAALRHIQTRHGRVNVEPLTKAILAGNVEQRIALLPVCSGLADPDVRLALRAALQDPELKVREAAIRALCDTKDAELLPDLTRLVRETSDERSRTLAIGACVRLTTQEEDVKLPESKRVEVLKDILASARRADQKRLVLAGLAALPTMSSLKLAEPLLEDEAVRNEAAQAIIKITAALPLTEAEAAAAALKKLLAAALDETSRTAGEAALKRIQTGTSFISAWQVAGPFVKAGKNYAALFDIPFPPEIKNGPGAKWHSLPPSVDRSRPWLMNLLKEFGGEERVAYARTWFNCGKEQPARLELGTDDGVKVWFNDKLVHSNNTFRGLQPGSDKVNITLKAGWNSLLLKITQLNQGWEFCARIVNPDGSAVAGLQFDPEHEAGK